MSQLQVKMCVMGDGGAGKTASTIQFIGECRGPSVWFAWR